MLRVTWLLVVLSAWLPPRAAAEQVTVLCSNGLKAVMLDLIPEFERTTGHRLVLTFSVAAELKKRIDNGEPFDVAVLTPPAIDDLIARGMVRGETRAAIARSGMALAVRRGRAMPDVRTVDALTRTLLASRSIAFAREGSGGIFFMALVTRLNLTAQLTPKFRPVVTGDDVSRTVANGDAELGILPMSEIISAAGISLAGPFPADVQEFAMMVGGVSGRASQPAAAGALLRFLLAPSADAVIQKRGMERPR